MIEGLEAAGKLDKRGARLRHKRSARRCLWGFTARCQPPPLTRSATRPKITHRPTLHCGRDLHQIFLGFLARRFARSFLVSFLSELSCPDLSAQSLLWTVVGAVLPDRGNCTYAGCYARRWFVVTIAYTKTRSPANCAVYPDFLRPEGKVLPVGRGHFDCNRRRGTLSMAVARRAAGLLSWRPAVFGMASGGLFAIAAVAFCYFITALETTDFVLCVTLMLGISLTVYMIVFFLAARSPPTLDHCTPS